MKYVLLLLSVQLLIAISSAQITFTREWVTGKRSSPYLSGKPAESSCKTNLMPAIKYLMEIDNVLREFCGPQYLLNQAMVHQVRDPAGEFPWKLYGTPGTSGDGRTTDDGETDALRHKSSTSNGSKK